MLYKLPGTFFFIPVYLDLVRPLFSDHCFLFNSFIFIFIFLTIKTKPDIFCNM